MSPTKGKPVFQIRLEPDVLEKLKAKIPPSERGRGGGVSHYVRRLIYADLGLGAPPRFATDHRALLEEAADLFERCLRETQFPADLQREFEASFPDWEDYVEWIPSRAREAAKEEPDPEMMIRAGKRSEELKEKSLHVPEPAQRLAWIAFAISEATRWVTYPEPSAKHSREALDLISRFHNTLEASLRLREEAKRRKRSPE